MKKLYSEALDLMQSEFVGARTAFKGSLRTFEFDRKISFMIMKKSFDKLFNLASGKKNLFDAHNLLSDGMKLLDMEKYIDWIEHLEFSYKGNYDKFKIVSKVKSDCFAICEKNSLADVSNKSNKNSSKARI